jgi:hypothetical protein
MRQDTIAIEQNYRHDVVRDLAWAIASPPLMLSDSPDCEWFDAAWYQHRYNDSAAWLQTLDQDPAPLHEAVAAQKDRRLGNYFETLWAYWLEANQRYDLLARNLPIREGGATLGELDFIVRDNLDGLNYHWEVAVKFYLGVGDTRQPANWHGPGRRDRLDIKLKHLRERQSQMCRMPQTQALLHEQGIDIAGCGVILKGRLFYPHEQSLPRPPQGACASHLHSRWFRLADLRAQVNDDDWFHPLLRSGWMSEHSALDDSTGRYRWRELEAAIEQKEYRLPLCLAQISGDRYTRLFLVPDDWDLAL